MSEFRQTTVCTITTWIVTIYSEDNFPKLIHKTIYSKKQQTRTPFPPVLATQLQQNPKKEAQCQISRMMQAQAVAGAVWWLHADVGKGNNNWHCYGDLENLSSSEVLLVKFQERERKAFSLSRGSIGTSEAPGKKLSWSQRSPVDAAMCKVCPSHCFAFPLSPCVKGEGKDKFQKAGMFPESMYFLEYLKFLAFFYSALLLVLFFPSAILYSLDLAARKSRITLTVQQAVLICL